DLHPARPDVAHLLHSLVEKHGTAHGPEGALPAVRASAAVQVSAHGILTPTAMAVARAASSIRTWKGTNVRRSPRATARAEPPAQALPGRHGGGRRRRGAHRRIRPQGQRR